MKAAVKRYIKGEGRLAKLLDELERRKTTNYLKIWGDSIVINGREFRDLAAIEANKETLGLALKEFLPHFYIYDSPYEDYIRYHPENVHKNENGTVDLITRGFGFRFTMENGQAEYAEITNLFRIWVKEKDSPALPKVLTKVLGLSAEAAEQAVQNAKDYSGEWEIQPFVALTRDEAGQVFHLLKKAKVKCRVLPNL